MRSHRTGKKKKKSEKKERKWKTDLPVQTPTGLTYVVCAWLRWGRAGRRAREAFGRVALGGYLSIPCNGMDGSISGCKGVQGGARVVGGGGRSAQTQKKKKNTTCSSCCACAADVRVGGRRSDGALMLETVMPARACPYWFCATFHRS